MSSPEWKNLPTGPQATNAPAYINPLLGADGKPNPAMQMGPGVQSLLSGINQDPAALNKFTSEAMRTGPSPWATMAKGEQTQAEKTQRDQAAAQDAGGVAQAQASLAQSGGLTSGARERVAAGGARNALDTQQGIQTAGNENRLQIGMNDEQNRINELSQVPGMQEAALQIPLQKAQLQGQANQFDIGQTTGQAANQNAYNMGQFTLSNQLGAANAQANATAAAGKKGFLGLG